MAENNTIKTKRTLLSDLRNPVVLISLFLAVISIAIAIYAYYNPRVRTEFAYTVEKNQVVKYGSIQKFVNMRSALPIDNEISSKSAITSDIYETIFEIWNSGIFPVGEDDVKEPFLFSVEEGEILGAEIVKQSNPSVAKFMVHLEKFNKAKLTWHSFEPGFGLQIRILHNSSKKDAVLPSAYISKAALTDVVKERDKFLEPFYFVGALSFIIGMLFAWTYEIVAKRYPKIYRIMYVPGASVAVFGFIVSAILIGLIYLYFGIAYNSPDLFD